MYFIKNLLNYFNINFNNKIKPIEINTFTKPIGYKNINSSMYK
jgi:hypothetical protein